MVLPFYILIHAEKGQGDFVAQEANKIKGVKMAHHVTGSIDVILYAEADDFSDIRRTREAVFGIPKVVRTETAIHV
ncbi:Lrp/AsnC ligand binding domain-containing protein [Candidatus Bathyarchaeota archaeon]|nr:Lrp/AsnC ligand binding domain-containing protein [Candidatus Bathyarchaeota archaeon]